MKDQDNSPSRLQRKKAVVDGRIAAAKLERGVLLVNTGTGKGKPSAALRMVKQAFAAGVKAMPGLEF